jgi:hypothetical protein
LAHPFRFVRSRHRREDFLALFEMLLSLAEQLVKLRQRQARFHPYDNGWIVTVAHHETPRTRMRRSKRRVENPSRAVQRSSGQRVMSFQPME